MSTQIQNQSLIPPTYSYVHLILWSAVWLFPFLTKEFPFQHNVFGAFVGISFKFSQPVETVYFEAPCKPCKELIRDFFFGLV